MTNGIGRRIGAVGTALTILLIISPGGWALAQIACPLPPVPDAKDAHDVQAFPGAATSVYLDGSLSMAGFLRNTLAAGGTVFHDILSTLPDLVAETARFIRFGSSIEQLADGRAARQAATEGFYRSPLNKSSRIDLVLDKAAEAAPGDLAIIVTDLFLSGSDANLASGPLRQPLTKAMMAGKAVAIVGIVGRYKGRIDGNDLPSGKPFPAPQTDRKTGKTISRQFEGLRPFYLVFVGPEGRIVELLNRRDWKRMLAESSPKEQSMIVYSYDLVGPVGPGKAEVSIMAESVRKREVLRNAGWIPQFIIDRADLRKDEPVLSAAVLLQQVKMPPRPGYARGEGLQVSTTLYQFEGADSPCGRGKATPNAGGTAFAEENPYWKTKSTEPLVKLASADEKEVRVDILAAPLMRLQRGGVFLLEVTVVATQVRQDGGGLGWLQEWSFEAKDEEKMRRTVEAAGPANGFLPTLNLWPLNQSLIGILGEKYPGEPVARARVAFRIE